MIVDWFRNCEQIEKTHMLKVDDASDSKYRFKQEIVYVNYLLHFKKMTEDEAFLSWSNITNGVSNLFKDDYDQLHIEFRKILLRAQKPKYLKINYVSELKPVTIYQQEVDFLNNLDVPVWIKQYWGCLLFYYKFERQNTKRVEKSPTLNAWCIRHTDYKRKNYGGNCQDIIAHCKINLPVDVIKDFTKLEHDSYPSYAPVFRQRKGKIYQKYNSIDDIDDFLTAIKQNTKVCTKCGKEFTISSKNKRDICDECYQEQRREKVRAARLSNYYKNKEKKQCKQEKGNLL